MFMQLVGIFLVLLVPTIFWVFYLTENHSSQIVRDKYRLASFYKKVIIVVVSTFTVDGMFSLILWLPLVGLEFLF